MLTHRWDLLLVFFVVEYQRALLHLLLLLFIFHLPYQFLLRALGAISTT